MLFSLSGNKAAFLTNWKVTHSSHFQRRWQTKRINLRAPSAVSKKLDKLIFDKLSTVIYLKLSPNQHGFRTNKSTVSNVMNFFPHLYTQLDLPNSTKITAFHIDFQETFGRVSHQRFEEKISEVGIGHVCFNLMKSYLEQRRQTVTVMNQMSSELAVLSVKCRKVPCSAFSSSPT